ncbi:ribosomal-protein-alanine N-acetyltransferase [Winogradskyella epiphytica]|uniref:Ribosomal-protein-alanine N-acetyltransferase n=1 Tax=Winogradskyella epiphytica TaxID=262005 RepID=A0A2V4YFW7_9FLAO|nr:GNAT family N-acetyltransferase [Winogradskyella epiphytica]PYE82813.1 ribosomal-protein-alanine N-acetyltransferase [Winogradskyella epiphytica]GGW53822.1 acetyltransferase [Winogradskyella epiphytica]
METQVNESVFDTFPELESDRLLYRAYTLEDAESLFKIRSHKEVATYMDTDIPKSSDDTKTRIETYQKAFTENNGIIWAIIEKQSNTHIGDFGIWRIDKKNARGEIGYILHPDFWNKGYMTEAMATLIRFGFKTLNLHSYEANVNIDNENSKRLLLNFGFKLEAYFRENFYYNGQFLDSEIYCLLESDLK